MVRIATCESGLNPKAVNLAGYYGLFELSGSFDGWDDPTINARAAYATEFNGDLFRYQSAAILQSSESWSPPVHADPLGHADGRLCCLRRR